jgi:DNA polymerase-3 subunit beta
MTAVELTADILAEVTPEIAQAELDRRAQPKTDRGRAANRAASQLWAPQLKAIAAGNPTVEVVTTKTRTAPVTPRKPAAAKPKARTRKPAAVATPAPAKPFDGQVKALAPVPTARTTPEVTIGCSDLVDAIKAVEAPTKTRQSVLPVLKCVLITADGDQATLTTTDLDMTMQVAVPATVKDPGTVAVPLAELKALLPTAKKNQAGTVNIAVANDVAIVTTEAGVSSSLRFADLAEFPRLPNVAPDAGARIELDVDAIAAVLPCVAADDTRPILNGMLFDGNTLVATDSYRLAEVTSPTQAVANPMLVPGRFLKELVKSAKRAVAVASNHELLVTDEDGKVMVSRLIEGEFPNVKGLIPDETEHTFRFDADEMAEVIRGLLANKPQSTTPVRFSQSSGGKFQVRMVEADRFDVTVPVKGTSPLVMGFNPKYLRDFIDGGFGTFGANTALKPVLAERTDEAGRKHRRLLMPVRLDK